MLKDARAYSGFSTNDVAATKEFYANTLGVDVSEDDGMLTLRLGGGGSVLIYPKEDHQPADYTCLNFEVANIDAAVADLASRGVTFERYAGMEQDEKGVMRTWGPPIAWFKDPAGNILSVIQAG